MYTIIRLDILLATMYHDQNAESHGKSQASQTCCTSFSPSFGGIPVPDEGECSADSADSILLYEHHGTIPTKTLGLPNRKFYWRCTVRTWITKGWLLRVRVVGAALTWSLVLLVIAMYL